MKIEVANAEVVDKASILRIKLSRLTDPKQRENVARELDEISAMADMLVPSDDPMYLELHDINDRIWDTAGAANVKVERNELDDEFIAIARRLVLLNNDRAQVKRLINEATGSVLVEEKDYFGRTAPLE